MRKRHAFTLVELLVVIGIIAVLVGILLPALSRSKDQAYRIQCMSNLRQMMVATLMYANDYKQTMPACNWGNGTNGWLYGPKTYLTGNPADVETGMLWPYLKTRNVYRCPVHPNPNRPGVSSENITSYLMNGAVQDYVGDTVRPHRLSYFKVGDVIYWEAGETPLMVNGPPWNDGSSFPYEWLTERHGGKGVKAANAAIGTAGGACLVCIDGHAEYMSRKEYEAQSNPDKVKRPNNRFWFENRK